MRTTSIAATTALLLTLTACGSSHNDSDGKPAGKPSPTSSAARQAAYLKAAHSIAFTGSSPTDTELAAYPPKWCAGLADGHSAAWLFSGGGGGLYPIGMDWGTVKKNASQLLVAGVRAYCPQHLDAVTAELRESGEY